MVILPYVLEIFPQLGRVKNATQGSKHQVFKGLR